MRMGSARPSRARRAAASSTRGSLPSGKTMRFRPPACRTRSTCRLMNAIEDSVTGIRIPHCTESVCLVERYFWDGPLPGAA